MKSATMFILVPVVCGTVLFGCRTKEEGKLPDQTGQDLQSSQNLDTPTTPAPLSEGEETSMAATVNGKEITRSEVERATDMLLMQYKDRIPPEQMAKAQTVFKEQALENLINQNLLLQEADKQGVKADPDVVEARFKQVSGRFPDEEAFQKAVESAGVSTGEIREDIRQNLKVENLLEGKLSGIKEATQEEISTFYKENPQNFQMPEKVRAQHILIAAAADDSPEEREKKRSKALQIRDQIGQGADFSKLAQEYSDCPSKSKGGDLGYFGKGQMVKPFEETAFQMKVGDVSDVVETQFGYHIIKLMDRQAAGIQTMEQAQGQIASFLTNQKKQQAVGDYVNQLRESATIEYGGKKGE